MSESQLPDKGDSPLPRAVTLTADIREGAHRRSSDTRVIISAYLFRKLSDITRVSGVIRSKGSDLIFDHPYNAESARVSSGSE
jgi:hypothetical protein